MSRGTEADPLGPAGNRRPVEWLLRVFGFGMALLYLGLGSIVVLVMLIGGLWAGFARAGYVLSFFAIFIYVFGTGALALWLGFRPSHSRGFLLAALVFPGLLYIVLSAGSGHGAVHEAAHTFAANETPVETRQARAILLEHGRRAGRKAHVDTLLQALTRAESDAERVRLICVLGELSYQYDPLLAVLRELRNASADDPERALLQEVSLYALYGVNPYEDMGAGEGAAQRPPQPQVCQP